MGLAGDLPTVIGRNKVNSHIQCYRGFFLQTEFEDGVLRDGIKTHTRLDLTRPDFDGGKLELNRSRVKPNCYNRVEVKCGILDTHPELELEPVSLNIIYLYLLLTRELSS